jgi:hypothetical protein
MVLLAFRGLHPDGTDERAAYEAKAEQDAEQASAERNGSAPGHR